MHLQVTTITLQYHYLHSASLPNVTEVQISTVPENNSSPLKINGWKMIHLLLGFGLFSGVKLLSFRAVYMESYQQPHPSVSSVSHPPPIHLDDGVKGMGRQHRRLRERRDALTPGRWSRLHAKLTMNGIKQSREFIVSEFFFLTKDWNYP